MRRLFSVFLIIVFLFSSASAQQIESKKKSSGTRRQLATIVFAGLGGAILGLSTLSFYGRPQDNLSNIAIGFAVGVIAGTIYVTFKTATTHDYYDEPEKKDLNQPSARLDVPRFQMSPLVQFREGRADGYGAAMTFHF